MHHLLCHLNKLFSPPHTHTHSVFMSSYDSHNKQLIFPHISNGIVFIMQIECVICEVRTGFVCIIQIYLNAKAGVWSRGSSCGIWGGHNGSGKAFSPSTSVSPCQYHSTSTLYSVSPCQYHSTNTLYSVSPCQYHSTSTLYSVSPCQYHSTSTLYSVFPCQYHSTSTLYSVSPCQYHSTSTLYSVSPCQYHSTNAPHSSSSTCCSYLKDKRAMPGNLPKQQYCFGKREGFDTKYFHIFWVSDGLLMINCWWILMHMCKLRPWTHGPHIYRYASHNDVPHIRRWPHKIIIL